jgi:hypothetical protein
VENWGGIFLTVYLKDSISVLEVVVVVVVAVVVDAAGLGVVEDDVVDALDDAGVDALEDVGVVATTGATWIFGSLGSLFFLGIVFGG